MAWTSALSLQLIATVQRFSGDDIWKFVNDDGLNWQLIFEQTSWPSRLRPEDLRKRWNDIIKQFTEESGAKRAKEVRFEDLARFLNGRENVASWRVLLEQTCPLPHWYVTTHQGQVLEPKLLLRLANGKADLQEEEEVHLLARALSRFPILTHIEEVVLLLETKSSFFYVVTSKESTELAFIDATQRCFIWRIAPTATLHFLALPELISQLPQALVRTCLSSSLIERRIMFLYVISKASLAPEVDIFSTWTSTQAASLSIFADLVQQGLSLKMRPSLPLISKYLLDALPLLNINVPEWLQYMGKSIPESEESWRHVAQCLLEQTNIAIQLVVIQLGNTGEVSFSWADQSHPLCLVAKSKDQAYAPVLRLEQQSNGSVQITFPFPDAIYQLDVNTRFVAVSKSLSIDVFQKLIFMIEGKKISIANQERHLLECTSKQQMANETEKCLVLSKIDALLESNCLRRNSVQKGDFCLLRAVLLAQGKEDTHEEMISLLTLIWNRAKEKQFTSSGLTDSQRQELLAIKDLVQLYSQMSSSSSSAFECFWNMPYHLIAQVLSKDVYLLQNDSSCIRYSKHPNMAPSIISLSELAQLLHSNVAIALIQLRLPSHTLHIEWLSSTLTTKQLELLEEIFTEPSIPQSPQRDNNTVLVPPLSPQTQLETLLSGGSLDISASTMKDRWWSSWETIYQKFRTSTGSVVRYSRQKENPNIWRQQPASTTLRTLELWFRWHETAKQLPVEELQDLYYLIDVEVEEKDLNDLIKEIPVMGLLDDRTSPYSLHTYLRKVCPNLHFPDLRPRLYFAPGIIPGAISTPLHLDGFGHMTSYHWYLGFEKESSNLVDIYPSEEDMGEQKWKQLCHTVGAALSEAGYELPHAVYHDSIATVRHGCDEYDKLAALGIFPTKSIELKAGEIIILPAGQPHAFKKWSTTTMSHGPLVSLAGDIAWIGSTQKETLLALTRMMKVEESLEKSYCLPELSMMASLMCDDQDRSALFKEHIAAFLPYLREMLSQELDAFAKVDLTETATRSNDPSIWLCSSCEKVIINTVIWCRIADEAYCLECYPRLSLKRRGDSKRARGSEDFTASFRFAHPAALMKKLMELESVIHPSTTPKKLLLSLPSRSIDEVIVEISEAIRLQKIDTDHRICKLGLDIEKSCNVLPKHTLELILLLNRDIPLFCHTEDVNVDECPLLATASEREHRYEEDFRRRFRCVICHAIGSWNRPLLSCIESTHHQNPPFFHLDCAGYRDKKVPSGAKLLCPTCVRDKRNDRSAIEFRNLHVWEFVMAEVELYRQGYRVIQIPKDGLCFLTVLYMMTESTTIVPEAKEILDWAVGIPHLLLLEKSANAEENTPLKSVESEVKKWSSRSLDEWKSHWDTEGFDGVCTALPKLLEEEGILGSNFHRYSYQKETMKGSWFNSSGSPIPSSIDVNFAVLFTETPIPHYSLVERHSGSGFQCIKIAAQVPPDLEHRLAICKEGCPARLRNRFGAKLMVLLLALLLAQVLPVAGQCYTGGSVAVPVTTYGKAWGCSGISAGSIFEGRIVSYNGDSFATILFTEANFIAWKASQKSSCLNPNCTATIKGSPWSFWYRFPVSGTYFIVVVCQNMLVDCNLDIDLSWGEKKPALQWNDWLILFGGLCVTVMLVFLFVICVRACLQGCAKQKDKADQEMQALSQEEDVLEAAAASAPEEAI